MKKYLILIFLFITGVALANDVDQKRPEVGNIVKAWEGAQGEQVWTLRYGKPEDHKALVQIVNIDHPWNKKIFLTSVEEKNNNRSDYVVMQNNKRFVALITNNYSGELYLPNQSSTIQVYFNKALSSEGNAQYFLTDYLNQQNGDQ